MCDPVTLITAVLGIGSAIFGASSAPKPPEPPAAEAPEPPAPAAPAARLDTGSQVLLGDQATQRRSQRRVTGGATTRTSDVLGGIGGGSSNLSSGLGL